MKERYIELMDRVLDAYTRDHIRSYTAQVKENGICEHGYPRLVSNLGILIAHGKREDYRDEFVDMMNLCCRELPVCHQKNGDGTGNDFSVKEVVFCILEIEKNKAFDKSLTDSWRSELAKIDPMTAYTIIASVPPVRIGNWAAFGAASEQLRKYASIGDESFFIENQIESQLFSFDENGMYRDPNEPMVYDFVTRLQLATALYFGFDGECRQRLEEELLKSADITLLMQSVTGEIPYGGRSNQFLHNESFYAALCEFYASWFNERGDIKKAGMFKRAAQIAIDSIVPLLQKDKITHIKNSYPTDSKYGCEEYAYFDKYMVTTGSWLYLAYAMADDIIEEEKCPSENQNYIWQSSDYFHKIFCKFGDYFTEIDTNADYHYEGSGLGRIHKKGAPSAICLSLPFTDTPNYVLDMKNESPFSICGGIETPDGFVYGYDRNVTYTLKELEVTDSSAYVKLECQTPDSTVFYTALTVSDSGVCMEVTGDGNVEIVFPVFVSDGENMTDITSSSDCVCVGYEGYECRWSSDDEIFDKNTLFANRNGHYKAMGVKGKNKVKINIEIK